MIILGINAYHGDASAALVVDGKLIYAVEEERLNRIKHSAGLPIEAACQVLNWAGISPEDIDFITTSRNPSANLLSKLKFVLTTNPSLSFLKDRLSAASHSGDFLGNPGVLLKENKTLKAKGVRVEHHLSHAASAFYPSGFEKAALLTVDGFGDFSSVLFGTGEGNHLKVLKRILFPHSVGVLYTAATQFIGFPKYGDEYKVMGLAGFGEPRFLKEFREMIHLESDGAFKLNLDYFLHPKGQSDMTWSEGGPILGSLYSEKWTSIFGPPRRSDEKLSQRDKDIAASMQSIFEEVYFHLMNHLYQKTKLENLCLAGGCAMNSLANGKIFDKTPFRKVYIQAAAGDAGTALGSAFYLAHHRLNQPREFVMDHAYYGPAYSKDIIKQLLELKKSELKNTAIIHEFSGEDLLYHKTARAIADGKVVGWFQGKMEWGARALGNRSILVDPRHPGMKDILNKRIKHREGFRPFAPSVLEEKANDWFEMKANASPFMNLVFAVRSEKKEKIPAVTHVDDTARVHTVTEKTNAPYTRLIREFEKMTGVPMLLNTSFNENEPIVCNPGEALECFLRTQMDVLVLGPYFIERRNGSVPNLKS